MKLQHILNSKKSFSAKKEYFKVNVEAKQTDSITVHYLYGNQYFNSKLQLK